MSLRRKEVVTPLRSRPMNALSMLRDWRRQVQDDLLPELHGHQSKAMADLSFAMTLAQHCQAGKLAVAVPGDAKPASVERRVERFLANDRIDPTRGLASAGPIVPGRLGRRADRADPGRDPQPQRPAVPEGDPGLSQARLAAVLRPATPRAASPSRCPSWSSACSAGWPPACPRGPR